MQACKVQGVTLAPLAHSLHLLCNPADVLAQRDKGQIDFLKRRQIPMTDARAHTHTHTTVISAQWLVKYRGTSDLSLYL